MSNTTRKVERTKGLVLALRTAQIVQRHEAMLAALDVYITGLEKLLIAKGIVTTEQLEQVAAQAVTVAENPSPSAVETAPAAEPASETAALPESL